MIPGLLAVAALTVAAGVACALVVRRMPRLSQQLLAVCLFAAATPVLAVASTGALMLSTDDALAVAVVGVSAGVSVGLAAWLLSRHVARPVRDVHDAARALAAGDLDARAVRSGPREAAELATAFNDMADSVQRTFDARRDLVAWASHDLRTPVASLLAMVEAVEDGIGPAERYLPQIADSTRHLRALVEDLFDLARSESVSSDGTSSDACTVAERVVRTHLPALPDHVELTLTCELPSTCVAVAELDLARILENVLGNAVRFARSRVNVRVVKDGSVVVSDDGPGFPADQVDRVFEPFWRADVTQEHRGAGLGLAIAERLARRNGASVHARNEGGAVVELRAPLAREPVARVRA